jgi:Domain of unknown function (DUF4143)
MYVSILEQLFLVRRVEPWFRNQLKRLVKTPKLHFLDSGLLGTLLGITAERVARDRSTFGTLLETFVFSEVLKQVSWFDENCSLCHYRDKDQDEVDLVIENGIGALVGIEVKATATVNVDDFKGLRKLSSAGGDDFSTTNARAAQDGTAHVRLASAQREGQGNGHNIDQNPSIDRYLYWNLCSSSQLRSGIRAAENDQASQGLTTGTERSSKWATLRVARVAWRATTMPAIIVSRSSPGRPLRCREAIKSAASVAASSSKGAIR